MNKETKDAIQVHHEAILTSFGIVGGGFGLFSSGVETAAMILHGPEYVINLAEHVSTTRMDVIANIIHYSIQAGIPLQVTLGGVIAVSTALLVDGIIRYRQGRRRFDNK